ncbi:uncharacterized protein LOC128230949 [Mya arenaria]|uniref:uncharacterized protein LOC128230949 n=1 Tax=Mya arenaria TaxID=6604 RepID=UPI0022E3CD4F|nr:uncharacterized protein LOC128230949 [Mya arenaria]
MAREAAGQLGESPSAVSEVQGGNYDTEDNIGENCTPEYVLVGSSCTESPVTASEDDVGQEGDDYFIETSGDERMAIIEEEYIDRITMLEQRNYDLEIVLRRLTSAVERLLCLSEDDTSEINTDDVEGYDVIVDIKPQKEYDSPEEVVETDDVDKIEDAEDNFKADAQPEAKDASVDDAGEAADGSRKEGLVDSTAREVSRNICIELFIEFQKRLMMFAGELKGVLSCGESAIRHGRVVQEWGKSVQLMFEQLLHERRKMMNFIDEREQTLMLAREQFIGERQEQGTQLEHLLEDMKKYRDLVEETETVCRDRMLESSQRRAVAEGLADQLLQRRLDEERAIILGLSRQSKISEMKLFIMHQQNCIQDLQIQNRELRAVIEGLVGPDDLESEEPSETEKSCTSGSVSAGTPASVGTPERCLVMEMLDKVGDQPISLMSDVLNCDRGHFLPGISTDGDLATIQAYGLGGGNGRVKEEAGVEAEVFDPLSVDYVREHCRRAEETERNALAHTFTNENEAQDDGRLTPETDRDVMVIQDGVKPINIEPYLRKRAAEERAMAAIIPEAAGDGGDVKSLVEAGKRELLETDEGASDEVKA